MRNKGNSIVLLLILAVSWSGFSQAIPWNVYPTGANHSIFIPHTISATVEGEALETGDAIGVFYDSLGTLVCAGISTWKTSGNSITAYGNFGNLKGFKTNEPFKFKIWRKAQNCIIDSVQVLFASPDQILITDNSQFADNGVSQINQIKGFKKKVSYAKSVYCLSENNPVPVFEKNLTSFVSQPGLSININTGEINLKKSLAGKHTIYFQSSSCLEVDSFVVTLLAGSSIILGNDTSICNNDPITLGVNNKNATFLWSTGASSQQIKVGTPGIYWLQVTDNQGCKVTDSIIVNESFLDISGLQLHINNAGCKTLGQVNINENSITKGLKPYRLHFTNTKSSSTIESLNAVTILEDGYYNLSVSDAKGCTALYPKPIVITKAENCENPVLAPESDGQFSSFFIPYQSGTAKIFDRFGQLRKQISLPAHWDGKDDNGNIVPLGDYYIVSDGEKSLVVTVIK